MKVINNGGSFHRFVAKKGSKLSVSVRAESVNNSINFKLIDVKGNEIDSESYIYNGESRTITYTAPLSGLYYVGVYGQGKYSLTYAGVSTQTDSDGDKLTDDQEYYYQFYYGQNPISKDSDGDGVDDYTELSQGKSAVNKIEYSDASLMNYTGMSAALELKNFDTNCIFAKASNSGTWFKFTLNAKESVTVLAESFLSSGYVNLNVYNSEGSKLYARSYLYNGGYDTYSISTNISTTYYIYVDGNGIGKYRLALHHNWNSNGMNDSKRIYNSTINTAKYIKSGYQQLNNYYTDTVLRFKATAGKNFIIDFAPSITSNYLNMYLCDQYGNELNADRYIYSGETGKINYTPALSGYYYLKITGYVREGNLTYSGIISEGDVTPPTLSAVTPKNNSVNVPVSSAVTLTFSEIIKAGSNYNKIALRTLINGKYVTVGAVVTIQNNTLVIKPKASLGYGKTYNVFMPSAAIKDNAGNQLKNDINTYFTTIQQVTFKNANLEKAVRNAINKPTGIITSDDMLKLKQLSASYQGINDLTGLEYAYNLQRLILNNNSITGITQLTNLKSLTQLDLSNNKIANIKPLEKLTKLNSLQLYNNAITSISALKTNINSGGFSALGYIDLRKNKLNLTKTSQEYLDILYLKSKGIYVLY